MLSRNVSCSINGKGWEKYRGLNDFNRVWGFILLYYICNIGSPPNPVRTKPLHNPMIFRLSGPVRWLLPRRREVSKARGSCFQIINAVTRRKLLLNLPAIAVTIATADAHAIAMVA